jgi:1D-myo-inositol-triphosphate 3-kinase
MPTFFLIQMPGGKLQKHFQKVRTREQVMLTLWNFFGPRAPSVRDQILKRLHEMRDRVTTSDFFRTHEVSEKNRLRHSRYFVSGHLYNRLFISIVMFSLQVVGSSLLFMYDENKASAWMIDFAKSQPILDGKSVDHRSAWKMGNHEDGYLLGLDNLIQVQTNRSVTRNNYLLQ